MPTLLRVSGYRFYFYSHEPNEPPHIHIDKSGASAKYWLENVSLARNLGYSSRELRLLHDLVLKHRTEFLEAWNEYFDKHS
jgi:hypothetical protein